MSWNLGNSSVIYNFLFYMYLLSRPNTFMQDNEIESIISSLSIKIWQVVLYVLIGLNYAQTKGEPSY